MASPSPPSWPHEKHRQLLSRDDYIDLRNSQDQQLNAEFTSVRCSIDLVRQELKNDIGLVKEEVGLVKEEVGLVKEEVGLVKQELKEFKDDVKAQTQRLEAQTQRLEAQTQRLEAQIRQSHAYMRNNALKNPSLPIRPVVVYRPEQGILEPELSQFPRNANEFYSLRDPRTDRHRSMLAYLAVFYDVRLRTADYPSEDDSGDDETFLDRPDIVVEKLEDILGLNEDKFDKFRERARQLATQSPSKPIKRSQIFLPDEESIPIVRSMSRLPSQQGPAPIVAYRSARDGVLSKAAYDHLPNRYTAAAIDDAPAPGQQFVDRPKRSGGHRSRLYTDLVLRVGGLLP
ncbi:wac domain-containing protein [Colletotrichum incanum]|nr:wac domain-containing protein [Colletotrichum incanum]